MDAATGTPTEVKVTTTEAAGANGIRAARPGPSERFTRSFSTSTSGTNWCVGRPQRTQQVNSHSLPYGTQQTRTLAT